RRRRRRDDASSVVPARRRVPPVLVLTVSVALLAVLALAASSIRQYSIPISAVFGSIINRIGSGSGRRPAGEIVDNVPGQVTVQVALLVVLALVAASIGQYSIPISEVFGAIMHRIGFGIGPMPAGEFADEALWQARFPRVVLAMLVGAALGCAGAVLQGVFANPLAEAGVIGVASGAAVGAASVIILGGAFSSNWLVAGAAFLGGLGTTVLVYALARANGRTEVVTVILTGVAVNALAGGLLAYLTFAAGPA